MPQRGRQPPKKASSATAQPQTAERDNWQRSSGAFSGAAKKDYLKWKRQQKAARAASNGDDETVGQQQHSGSQQPTNQGSLLADAAQPLRYRPLYAVPAEPFCVPVASAQPHGHLPVSSMTASSAAGSTESADLVASTDSSGPAAEMAYMPRLDPAEVGFTPAGFQLDMPTRPRWQGAVSTAEELHALEEAEFAAWQSTLAAKVQQLAAQTPGTAAGQASTPTPAGAAGGSTPLVSAPAAGRDDVASCLSAHAPQLPLQQGLAVGLGLVSSYEGRLEYWRQLWRTLEMSDMICMIVDARNPLLHFSHALYRHITQDHKLPLVLLLNKCDLLPAAAATAWQQYLQQQLPGVTVIPVSASAEQAAATARQVLSAVLQQQVEKDGCRVPVQELVGLSLDELVRESVQRNTHAKRHLEALQQQPQQQGAQHLPPQGSSAASAAPAAAATTSSDDDQQWSLKPSRGKRAARRKGRQQQQQMRASASHHSLPGASEAEASASDAEEAAAGHGGVDVDEDALQQHQQQQPMDEALAALTLEGRLPSTTASNTGAALPSPAPAAARQAEGCCPEAAAGAAGRAQAGDRRPVVVGMLGEPNVGKSSTLNALLGSHRVAVSSHPGRTKHYQTHYMCDSLVLVDCPGIVFPRLNVSPAMQILYGSSPIASCRQPYAVVRYLAEASWPRVHTLLKLHQPDTMQQEQERQQQAQEPTADLSHRSSSSSAASAAAGSAAVLGGSTDSSGWSAYSLCEALAAKRHFVLPRSGRLDIYRAANWLLRAALAGQHDLGLAFLPPA